jgi:hypothetical protein
MSRLAKRAARSLNLLLIKTALRAVTHQTCPPSNSPTRGAQTSTPPYVTHLTRLRAARLTSSCQIDPSGVLKGSVKGKSVLITGAGRGIGKVRRRTIAAAQTYTHA